MTPRSLLSPSAALRSRLLATGLALLTTAALAVGAAPSSALARGLDDAVPSHLDLPDGFQPEGIATGPGRVAYLGSLATGDIYRLDLRTGSGEVISDGPGTPSVGLALDDRGLLYVAGGPAGDARVVDTATGEVLVSYSLVSGGSSFINDVTLTDHAAWFTDSSNAALYRVPLGHGTEPAGPSRVTKVELTGEWEQVSGFNANGIVTAPGGRSLLVVNSTSGKLYRVYPNGRASVVDLDGASLTNGDGMLREGQTLYVVRNQLNRIAVIRLAGKGFSGERVRSLTSTDFDIPTTIARSGEGLYLPNARFTTNPTPTTPYWVTRIDDGQ